MTMVDTSDLDKKSRLRARVRALLEVLARHPQGRVWSDAWAEVTKLVPTTPEDLETTSTGAPRGENDLQWQLTNLDRAGWILRLPRLRITRQGQKALEEGGVEVRARAAARYATWDKHRERAKAPLPAPSIEVVSSELVPLHDGEDEVLAAALQILTDGLRAGGSAFAPGRPVWASSTVDELYEAFVLRPDSSGASFHDKLTGQLAGASDDAVLLVAELMAVQMLPLADFKPTAKRRRINDVLALMDSPVGMPLRVSGAMDGAVFNGSLSFKTLMWRTLSTGIEVARAWWRLDDAARERAWQDPWAWRDLLADAQGDTIPSALAELRYLLHPRDFAPIISVQHQKAIRDAFIDRIDGVASDDLHRDLRAIIVAEQQRVGGPVEWYEPERKALWAVGAKLPGSVVAPRATGSAPETAADDAARQAWLVRGSSVQGVDLVPTWRTEGFVSLPASRLSLPDLPVSAEQLRRAVDEGYASVSYAAREETLRELTTFLLRVRPGDLVATTTSGRLHLGEVTGEATWAPSDGRLSNLRRRASWRPVDQAVDLSDLPADIVSRLSSGSDVADLTDLLNVLATLTDPGSGFAPTEPVADVQLPHLTDEQADELLVARPWLDRFVDRLQSKRQVIVHGPPGTGKTFVSLQVAKALAPPENVALVQFHPAFTYEDFFEGYRPVATGTDQVGFRLKAGPLRRIVDRAVADPTQPFVLVVDEINRANLAKVFGELYFLLEYRDQTVELLYAEEGASPFQMPRNVFVIGTMNTSDRSIALVDAAMRRRFAFLSLHPGDPHMTDVLGEWLRRRDFAPEPADLLAELNLRVRDRDLAVGPSYLMTDLVDQKGGLETIWETEILPLLTEYHVGDDVDVDKEYGLSALRSAIRQKGTQTAPGLVDNADEGKYGVVSEETTGGQTDDTAP